MLPSAGGVGAQHEFAVGGAGGGQVVAAFVQLQARVDDLLFEVDGALLERVDVVGRAEPGSAPGVLAEKPGEASLELVDAGGLSDAGAGGQDGRPGSVELGVRDVSREQAAIVERGVQALGQPPGATGSELPATNVPPSESNHIGSASSGTPAWVIRRARRSCLCPLHSAPMSSRPSSTSSMSPSNSQRSWSLSSCASR